jgi:hypothetical protein
MNFEQRNVLVSRVARWYIFKPKIQIRVNFGGSCRGRCWYILLPFGVPMVGPFGIFYLFPFDIF